MAHLDNDTIDACAKQVDAVMKKHIDIGKKITLSPDDRASVITLMLEGINIDIQDHLQALRTEEEHNEHTNL